MKNSLFVFFVLLILPACSLLIGDVLPATRPAITIASVTPDLTVQITDEPSNTAQNGYYDALASTMGICFESAWDASDRVFIMRTAEEHIEFYNQVDNSNLCRRAIRREPFNFTEGDVLVGIWNRGSGCTANHEILSFERDDSAKTILIHAQFTTSGTCPYELVRGLWFGIENAQTYDIQLEIDD